MTNKAILNKILINLPQGNTYHSKLKEHVVEMAYTVYQTSISVNHPFTYMDGFLLCYDGTFWDIVPDAELKVFLKHCLIQISGSPINGTSREAIEAIHKQFPYTVMTIGAVSNRSLINYRNGELDFSGKTPTLVGHNWQNYHRYVLPYDYDSKATCPKFMKFLNEVVNDKEAQMNIAEFIAYIFMPELKLEKALFFLGKGRNGKSVMLEIMENLIGKENVSHESLSDLCGENGANSRSNIAGKLLNTCSDVSASAFTGDVFKRIASGEPISTKILYKDVVTITDYGRMAFCLNELPKTNDHSNGYYRRFLIIPFNYQIPLSKVDPNLTKTIVSSELPGIMNWVLEGRDRLIKNKAFTQSKLVDQALENYQNGGRGDSKIKLWFPSNWK